MKDSAFSYFTFCVFFFVVSSPSEPETKLFRRLRLRLRLRTKCSDGSDSDSSRNKPAPHPWIYYSTQNYFTASTRIPLLFITNDIFSDTYKYLIYNAIRLF